MPPTISSKWGALLAEEFTLQVQCEKELGIPVTAFMDGLTDPVGRAKSSLGFIDFVFFPLYDPLFRLFPGWLSRKLGLLKTAKLQQTSLSTQSGNQSLPAKV